MTGPSTAVPHPVGRTARLPHDAFAITATAIALWAAYQNLYRLALPPVLTDEPTYANAGWRYVHGQTFPAGSGGSLGALADNFEHPPLTKYLFGLAELVAGAPTITATRAIAALCTLMTAVALGVWVARLRGRWSGLMAAAAVSLLPVHVNGAIVRFGRYGMLDPVAELFMVLSVVAAWEWSRRHGPDALLWAVGTGALTGLAASAKENAFLGVTGTVALLVLIAVRARSEVRERVAQAAAAAVTAMAVFLIAYLPLGSPLARISYLLDAQTRHSRLGHPVGFAGRVSAHPPWWTNLWFAGHGWGAMLTTILVVGALAALALRRDRLTWWCLAALLGPVIFHLFVAQVTLPFYWTMWAPMFYVLSIHGWDALIWWIATSLPKHPFATGLVAPVLLLAVLIPPITDAKELTTLRPTGIQEAAAVLRANNLSGPVLVAGLSPVEVSTYLKGMVITPKSSSPGATDSVIVAQPRCRILVDRGVRALVSLNRKKARLRQIYQGGGITIFKATGPLEAPSFLDVAAQPPGSLSEGC